MAVNDYHPDLGRIEDLLKDPAGPIGRLIGDLAEQATRTAIAKVHVWPGTALSTIWNPVTSTAILKSREPAAGGPTKESIEVHPPVIGSRGGMYAGVDAIGLPSIFLEHRPKGARMMRERYPFMTTGLDELQIL